MEELTLKKDARIIEIEATMKEAIVKAHAVIVETSDQAKSCSDELGMLKGFVKDISKHRAAIVKPSNDRVKAFNNMIKPVTEKAEEAIKVLEPRFIAYTLKKEDEERARIKAINDAEAKRIREEAEAKEKEIIDQAELHNIPDLVDQAIEINEAAEAKATKLEEKQITVSTKSRGAAYGSSIRKTWTADIDNWGEFLTYVVSSGRFELVDVNTTQLNNFAKVVGKGLEKEEVKEKTNHGIKVYQKIGTMTR